MSMSLALEFTQEWLRAKNNWEVNNCGVQLDAQPAYDATNFYVGIDDAGVETGDERTDSLKEVLSITIGIWRRPEHLSKSKRGMLKLPTDKYLLGSWTLHDLERTVILPIRNGLHANYDFLLGLNTRYALPHIELGARFVMPFFYRGRGRMETIAIDRGGNDPEAWYGYRLRFRGLMREQKLRSASGTTEAQG